LTSAGTGSGKTLPIALNFLLDDPSMEPVTLTISPLKRLQSTQANDFSKKYNVPTLTINEDTPRDDAWWDVSQLLLFVFDALTCIYPQENVYNSKTDTMGKYRHLIVTVEQLVKDPSGHFFETR
jgi:hypothetical protein